MTTTPTSVSVRTSLGFAESLGALRQKLHRDEFRVIAQIDLHRDFEISLGLHWKKSVVLVVSNSFYAYQAALCGLDGGMLLPFNISVSEDSGTTLITTANHLSAGSPGHGSVGMQILARELNRRMEQIFAELAIYQANESGRLLSQPKVTA